MFAGGFRTGGGGLRLGASKFAALLGFFAGAFAKPFFVGGQVLLVPHTGPLFEVRDGPIHFGVEFLAAGDLFGQLLGVFFLIGFLGLAQQLPDIQLQLIAQLIGPLVGHVLVDRGVGFHVRAVQGNGAQLEEFEFLRQFQHVDKGLGHRREVFAAEGADRVVVGMGVGAEVTHGQVAMGGPFNAPGTDHAVGIAVDEQGHHHVRGILAVAGALVVDGEMADRKPVHRGDDEMNQVILSHPFAEIRGEQHRGIPIDSPKAWSHAHEHSQFDRPWQKLVGKVRQAPRPGA